jgi:hypothetical protein
MHVPMIRRFDRFVKPLRLGAMAARAHMISLIAPCAMILSR